VNEAAADPGFPVPAPAPAAAPAAARSRFVAIRGVLALVLGVVAAIAAVLLYRHGVQQWPFGPVPPETTQTNVPRYVGPWMVSSAAALLAAGLLLMASGSDAFRLVTAHRAADRVAAPAA